MPLHHIIYIKYSFVKKKVIEYLFKKLKDEDLNAEKLNAFWRLPVLSSAAISSVVYAAQKTQRKLFMESTVF